MMGSFREDNFNTLNTSLDISQDLGFVTKGLSAKVLVNFKNSWVKLYYTRSLSPITIRYSPIVTIPKMIPMLRTFANWYGLYQPV